MSSSCKGQAKSESDIPSTGQLETKEHVVKLHDQSQLKHEIFKGVTIAACSGIMVAIAGAYVNSLYWEQRTKLDMVRDLADKKMNAYIETSAAMTDYVNRYNSFVGQVSEFDPKAICRNKEFDLSKPSKEIYSLKSDLDRASKDLSKSMGKVKIYFNDGISFKSDEVGRYINSFDPCADVISFNSEEYKFLLGFIDTVSKEVKQAYKYPEEMDKI